MKPSAAAPNQGRGASQVDRAIPATAANSKTKWQKQSEQLRAAMRAANPFSGAGGGGYGDAEGGWQPAEEANDRCVSIRVSE